VLDHDSVAIRIDTLSNLTKTVALLMAVVWAFATMHCSLEQLPGFEFLSCCEHPGTAPHQDNDCSQDGCSVVEFGFYKANEQPAIVPKPLLLLTVLSALFELNLRNEVSTISTRSSVPSELARVWQFFFRTALPPRAPSFIA
jgi:hypothetical protein